MTLPELSRRSTLELEPLPMTGTPEDFWGIDKTVTKMTDGERTIAAKIYRTRQLQYDGTPGELINRPVQAISEFKAYRRLRQSPLGIYVPEPYFLLNDEFNTTVGLGVEWIEGKNLGRYLDEDPSKLLTAKEMQELSTRINVTLSQGIYIDPEMIASWNLIVKPDVQQRVFLGECAIDETPEYLSGLAHQLRELENFYTLKD